MIIWFLLLILLLPLFASRGRKSLERRKTRDFKDATVLLGRKIFKLTLLETHVDVRPVSFFNFMRSRIKTIPYMTLLGTKWHYINLTFEHFQVGQGCMHFKTVFKIDLGLIDSNKKSNGPGQENISHKIGKASCFRKEVATQLSCPKGLRSESQLLLKINIEVILRPIKIWEALPSFQRFLGNCQHFLATPMAIRANQFF